MEKKRIAEQMAADEDSEDNDYGEEGEHEMQEMYGEEGEYEMYDEEGEDEVSDVDSDEEEIPEVVPIQGQTINQEARYVKAETSSISDVNVDDYGSSSDDYDEDELNIDSTANPHGFMYANMLETFQKSRKDRIEEMREEFDRQAHRDKFKKKKQSKNIGKSEKMHQKNKPFMMMKKKKINTLREKLSNNKPTR